MIFLTQISLSQKSLCITLVPSLLLCHFVKPLPLSKHYFLANGCYYPMINCSRAKWAAQYTLLPLDTTPHSHAMIILTPPNQRSDFQVGIMEIEGKVDKRNNGLIKGKFLSFDFVLYCYRKM